MSLDRTAFADFFAVVNTGHRPFRWQERLLDHLLEHGRWPDRLVAPTGAGKTSVIDVHVFALALTVGGHVRLPRRLAMVVDRRVLVDDQHRRAVALAEALREALAAEQPGLLTEVACRLRELYRPGADPVDGEGRQAPSPLVVARLRGGERPMRSWLDLPTAAAVICATPDMWGSRLLFRGYGARSTSWPRAAGLLAVDAVAVVDEAHLSQQLLTTARRVRELVAVADERLPLPELQVVETTATPAGIPGGAVLQRETAREVGVLGQDLDDEPVLADRLRRPKPVTLVPVDGWPAVDGAARRAVDAAMVDQVVDLVGAVHAESDQPGDEGVASTVGCFVNTVSRAVAVSSALRDRHVAGQPLRVVLVCGQVRPYDLDRLALEHPGVLDPQGSRDVDVLVTTQSLEVGVDLDLAGVVTELAPGSALAQRAGRVNRRGRRRSGPVRVVVPLVPLTEKQRSGPYRPEDLNDALQFVQGRAEDPAGLAPWALRQHPPPTPAPRRTLLQRPELMDAWHWARTSDRLSAEPELDLWLAEDFDDDLSVFVVVRRDLPVDGPTAVRLLGDMPVAAHEQFTVPLRTLRHALQRWDEQRIGGSRPTVLLVRGGETDVLTWRTPDEAGSRGASPVLRPGDVVVVDDRTEIFTSSASPQQTGLLVSPPVVVPADSGQTVHAAADDVHEEVARLGEHGDVGVVGGRRWRPEGRVVLRVESRESTPDDTGVDTLLRALARAAADAVEDLEDADPAGLDDRRRQLVRDWLTALRAPTPMQREALVLLRGDARDSELLVHEEPGSGGDDPDPGGDELGVARAVVQDRRRLDPDSALRQVWSPAGRPITLADHQADVARRARTVAEHVGLPEEVVAALDLAGQHHDDGKGDMRFQVRLGGSGPPLAKSRAGTSWAVMRRRQERDGLPSGWRHEQRSVVECWDGLAEHATDPDLVARLVGTSHGHGRSRFPHTSAGLMPPGEAHAAAADLFDAGRWDELVEVTQRHYGVWGCAYLEALLRAADNQVSEEGH